MSIDPSRPPLKEINAAWYGQMTQAPQRFSVINLSTNEELIAQFNPTEFDDDVAAEFERINPVGASHQRLQFRNTSNYSVPLELFFSAQTEEQYEEITRARHLIQSWCYPMAATQASPSKGPPRLLATWPLVFSIECYLLRCKCKYVRFAPDGRCTQFTASVTFEECRDTRITSEQVALASVVRGEL